MDLLFEGISFNVDYWKTKSEKLFMDQLKVKGYFSGNPAKAKEAWKQIKDAGKVKDAAPEPADD